MFPRYHGRIGHYALLLAVAAGLFLPNLGAPSLWDIDEGNNAEAAREMLEAGGWIVPTFNFQLRTDKPALLYWLQIVAYGLFGVGEFAARLPSALAGMIAVLLTYELGRRMFGAAAGLLAGLVLVSTVLFCASAHFANPDALLNACTVGTFLIFWWGVVRNNRSWLIGAGVSTGLAVLAKGPVGFVLPLAVIGLFLLWSGQLRLLLNRRLVPGILVFSLVVVPWYAWVGVETRGDFLRGFFLTHNVDRYRAAMEGHRGPIYYYLAALALGFAPWSAFLGPAVWYALKRDTETRRRGDAETETAAFPRLRVSILHPPSSILYPPGRFLCCWIAVYFVFFSLSGTKLPNYILPIYPAVALLTARFLDQWRRRITQPPAWLLHLSLRCLALVGLGTVLGLLVAGGTIEVPALRGRQLPGLEAWAGLGLLPLLGAAAAWWYLRRQQRTGAVASVAVSSVVFVGFLAAWGGTALDRHKAPRPLVEAAEARQTDREIRVGTYQYFQPSLVFYCRREVARFADESQALEFLQYPLPVYLFLPASVWTELEAKVPGPCRLLARHRDFYRGCDVVVVTNR